MAAIAAACSLAACSVLTSLDGLTGGDADGGGAPTTIPGSLSDGASTAPGEDTGSSGSEEGGSSGSGASRGSGSSSGSSSGGGSGSGGADDSGVSPVQDATAPEKDASTGKLDAGPDAHDAAPPPYCASLNPAPLFCDDFDEGQLATPWDHVSGLSGTASLDTTYSKSAPNAMLAAVTANAAEGNIDVAGYKSLTASQGVAGTYTLAFDLRIDAADTSSASDAVLGAIQLWNGSAIWDLELEVAYSSTAGAFTVSMTEDSSSANVVHTASSTLPIRAWTRVSLAIVLPAGSGGATTATLTFNGDQVASATVHVTTSDPIPELVLGPTFATPASGGWAVRYDDVTFGP